jgi:O-antigen/teichoic acid export membrane protein
MLKKIDSFGKNIILVFCGTSLVNFFNLVYQLLIAHKLKPDDFAAINSLISITTIISSPLLTFQSAVAKYSAEYKARNQNGKVQVLLSGMLKKAFFFAFFTLVVFSFLSPLLLLKLKINSLPSGYMLAALLALGWILPVLLGGIQGLELFKWLSSVTVVTGALKLGLAAIFIFLGFNIAGALGAILLSTVIGVIMLCVPVRKFLTVETHSEKVDLREIFIFMLPVGVSTFCFMNLINMDMVLVKYFFTPQSSGIYSMAQMVGKVFWFLPMAISIVMFPKTSGLCASNLDTSHTLKRSLSYAAVLCVVASVVYNFFPALTLKILTGKVVAESLFVGRLFSVSMVFFAVLFILINYFLSIKDLRFIKYLIFFTIAQFLAIVFVHNSLTQVQLLLCVNSFVLLCIHLFLAFKKKPNENT